MSTMVLVLRDYEYDTLISSIEIVDDDDLKFRRLIMDRAFILGDKLIGSAAEELEKEDDNANQ